MGNVPCRLQLCWSFSFFYVGSSKRALPLKRILVSIMKCTAQSPFSECHNRRIQFEKAHSEWAHSTGVYDDSRLSKMIQDDKTETQREEWKELTQGGLFLFHESVLWWESESKLAVHETPWWCRDRAVQVLSRMEIQMILHISFSIPAASLWFAWGILITALWSHWLPIQGNS